MGNFGSCFKDGESKARSSVRRSAGDGRHLSGTSINGSSSRYGKPLPNTPKTVQIADVTIEDKYTETSSEIQTGNQSLVEESQESARRNISKFYEHYASDDLNFIGAEGTEKLCTDLNLNPEDYRVLVLAYCLNAQSMCKFTEEEFTAGCSSYSVTDIHSLREALPVMRKAVVEREEFAKFYRWAYKFALDAEKGQRTLSANIAIDMWRLVFTDNVPSFLERWLAFIKDSSSIKGISKDTWDMFLIFVEQIGDDLTRYNDADSWPSLLDDFVEQLRENGV